jgi:hypothetical protein
MERKTGILFLILHIILILSCTKEGSNISDFPATTNPSFKVDYGMPTADKPQSKLWFMEGGWWALLPRSTGPSLWQRTEEGWKEYPEVAEKLKGTPGRADVWAEKNQVTAVGVADSSLTVFRLVKKSGVPVEWEPKVLAKLNPPAPGPVETATIAKDGKGNWWVAATANLKVCVWFSEDGNKWEAPLVLAEGIDADDICVITPLPGGVGVIWSNQVRDAVLMREHKDGNPSGIWEMEEVVDSGNKTADDHLNTSLTSDGTLWVTSKNSLDEVGKPQFVLRVRSAKGKWVNKGYCVLESRMKRPSRPIIIAAEDNSHVFVGHGDNDRSVPYPYNSNITFALVDTTLSPNWDNLQIVIEPDSSYKHVVHNVTGPKFPFPANGPWIILASDSEGRVYEADLTNFFKIQDKKYYE